MSQVTDKPRLSTARAEDALNKAGHKLGNLAATYSKRVQKVASGVRVNRTHDLHEKHESGKNNHHEKKSKPTNNQVDEQETMERADEIVGQLEQRLLGFTAKLGFRVQKATARLREEAEDMWAEAQELRGHKVVSSFVRVFYAYLYPEISIKNPDKKYLGGTTDEYCFSGATGCACPAW